MGAQRAHIVLPQELIAEIDQEVGPRGRSAFIAQVAKSELNRRKLLSFLERGEVVMKDEDHPEMAGPDGVETWVQSIRSEGEARLERAKAAWKD